MKEIIEVLGRKYKLIDKVNEKLFLYQCEYGWKECFSEFDILEIERKKLKRKGC